MKIFEEISNIKHLLTSEQIAVVDLLKKIDYLVVDENRVTLYEKNGFIIIDVFSKEDKYCSFSFDFGIKENSNQFRFYLSKSAPIFEVEMTENTLSQTIEAIVEFFRSEIFEELTFVNTKLVKAKYKYYSSVYREKKLVPHITIRKAIWFWQKKHVKLNEYEPWIR